MEDRVSKLESSIEEIKIRNLRVEAEKAWEVSNFRIVLIAIVTYMIAAIFMSFIKASVPLLSALVPTLGYIISTQSIPVIKKLWMKNYRNKNRLD